MPPAESKILPDSIRLNDFAPSPQKSSSGPIVGIIIIVALMLVGGFYFWGAHLNQKPETLPLIPPDNTAPVQ